MRMFSISMKQTKKKKNQTGMVVETVKSSQGLASEVTLLLTT